VAETERGRSQRAAAAKIRWDTARTQRGFRVRERKKKSKGKLALLYIYSLTPDQIHSNLRTKKESGVSKRKPEAAWFD